MGFEFLNNCDLNYFRVEIKLWKQFQPLNSYIFYVTHEDKTKTESIGKIIFDWAKNVKKDGWKVDFGYSLDELSPIECDCYDNMMKRLRFIKQFGDESDSEKAQDVIDFFEQSDKIMERSKLNHYKLMKESNDGEKKKELIEVDLFSYLKEKE